MTMDEGTSATPSSWLHCIRRIYAKSRTERDRQTSCQRNPARWRPCTAQSFVDTIGVDLPWQKDPLHFRQLSIWTLRISCPLAVAQRTYLMSAMVNRRMRVHIMPRISFKLPSMISARDGFQLFFNSNVRLTLRSDIGELYPPRRDKFQRLVYVLRLLYAHSRIAIVASKRRVT